MARLYGGKIQKNCYSLTIMSIMKAWNFILKHCAHWFCDKCAKKDMSDESNRNTDFIRDL